MRFPSSSIAGLVLNEPASGGRVAYLAADLDRTFARSRLPDHARLLANLTRWAAQDRIPISIKGPGFVHCQLYRQGSRLILHLVNLTGFEIGSMPVAEHFPVGPLRVQVDAEQLDSGVTKAKFLVAGTSVEIALDTGHVVFDIPRIVDHEVVVVG